MPSEFMDERRLSSSVCLPSAPSSFFSEEICHPTQRQVGFWKPESVPDHYGIEGMQLMSGSKSVSSSPLERVRANGGSSMMLPDISQPFYMNDQKNQLSVGHRAVGVERTNGLSSSWRAANPNAVSHANPSLQPASQYIEVDSINLRKPDFENSLFSSSLSDIFDKKMRLSSRNSPFGQSSMVNSNFEEDEPFESLKEVEAQTIGNLLPDDDDLLSGGVDDLGFVTCKSNEEDLEDDLFCSVGGMELETEGKTSSNKTSEYKGRINDRRQGYLNGVLTSGLTYSESPSRTLVVRNINNNAEATELRALFEQFGDVDELHTTCKAHGFVLVSYYDLRATQNAKRTLESKSLGHHELDIQFYIPKDNASAKDYNDGTLLVLNLDSSVSNDELIRIFAIYGDVKEINESKDKDHHKVVEFYDTRAAEAALNAVNGKDIAGKQIKLERCRVGGKQRLIQQTSSDVKQGYARPECYASIPMVGFPSGSVDNGALDLHSALQAAIRPMMETPFHGMSSSELHSLSSPVKVACVGNHSNQSNHIEASRSVGQVNFGLQGVVRPHHPRSLPEHHDGLISTGVPFNSSSGVAGLPASISSRTADVLEHKHIHRAVANGFNNHPLERLDSAFGISGSCAVHGQQFAWNSPNSYPNQPVAPMIWPNSPSFVNTITAHPASPQIHGLQRNRSHIVNAIIPLHHHHVGSAPAVNPSLWDRRHYSGDSMEGPGFHVGSLGSNGFPGGSHLNPLEFASRNMLHGNCMDSAISSPVGLPSRNMLNGRSAIIPMPSSYDGPSERIRSRRSDASSNLADNKKQFELDIDRIVRGEDSRTTLMIKNIPNKYTSKMLLAAIDENHRGTYDFFYLPIDFKNKCNVGYAFINMVNPQHIIPFYQTFNGKKWEKFNSEKVASLAYARIQGKQALIAHFQNSSLMNEDKRCRPILFCTEGPNAGDQEPFPVGVNIRSRPGRSKTNNNEENHQEVPTVVTSGEEPSGTSGSVRESET